MTGGSGYSKGSGKRRNIVATETSRETRAAALLTNDRTWSDHDSLAFRRSLVPVVTNTSLYETGQLSGAIETSIRGLKSITHSPLEIADLIGAWGIMFPEEPGEVIAGVALASRRYDPCAEAALIGCLEIANQASMARDVSSEMISYIGIQLGEQMWMCEECVPTPAANGRLSNGLSSFVEGLWAGHPVMNRRLAGLTELVMVTMRSNLIKPADLPRTLHDYVINELTAKIFLQAPAARRTMILRVGLGTVVEAYLKTLLPQS